jgi:hypothetical protein
MPGPELSELLIPPFPQRQRRKKNPKIVLSSFLAPVRAVGRCSWSRKRLVELDWWKVDEEVASSYEGRESSGYVLNRVKRTLPRWSRYCVHFAQLQDCLWLWQASHWQIRRATISRAGRGPSISTNWSILTVDCKKKKKKKKKKEIKYKPDQCRFLTLRSVAKPCFVRDRV